MFSASSARTLTSSFMNQLNNLHGNIKFTCEVGGGLMKFLEILIELNPNGFDTGVYRKPTHTGVVMQYLFNAPKQWRNCSIKKDIQALVFEGCN